jgi:hypothetical protein
VSVGRARELVSQWLTVWDCPDLVATATTVATIFVENVLEHTVSNPRLVLECQDDCVTVAVHDEDGHPPTRHEDGSLGTGRVSGLAIVGALSRAWGSSPTANGKTVWAVLGPENRL